MKQDVNCPRPGCGTPTQVNTGGKLETHKLPDGWRVCAASGATLIEAQAYDSPTYALPPTEVLW